LSLPWIKLTIDLPRNCAIAFLVILASCAGRSTPDNIGLLPAPDIEVGEEINLLDEATEKVVAHMTPNGWVHLVAITAKGSAYHVVVSARGVEHREKFGGDRQYGYYNNLAIADDGQGLLHVAIKDEYWIYDLATWHLAGNNQCSLLVRSGNSLACVVKVSGGELETPAQYGITGFGGFGAGVIIPYRIRPTKLVLGGFSEGEWSYRAVIDSRSPYFVNLETRDGGILASDAFGFAHILYRAHSGSSSHVRYATLPLTGEFTPVIEWHRSDDQWLKLANFESVPVDLPPGWFVPFDGLTFAVDPLTRKGVFFARDSSYAGFASWIDGIVEVRTGAFSEPRLMPFSRSKPRELAPAGGERFHVLVTLDKKLLYLGYQVNGWSGPVRIGNFGTSSMFLIGSSSIQLASDGRSQALAIWPKRDRTLAGRWVTLN
jgi:hypothetical protein